MNLFKRHIEYFKDNPQGYWFKRKLYGWGWTPVKWQGWLVIFIFFLFVLWSGLSITPNQDATNAEITSFIIKIILSIVVVILICYEKGEKPKWQWGPPKK
jgi:hypothetical protein